ncbi:MAG: DegT/DnrJ/EryC1/StrS aminotransferase family protein [bacterium]|nr:DegT/DnrJ/EryC1/StrS aminotransferase family protein [bacterium]
MRVPATKPYFSKEDIRVITKEFKKILEGKSFLSSYIHTEEFEKKFAKFSGTRFAVGCNSGTSALELICRSIGVAGKEVILPSNTFIATANAILNAGGIPVFADCTDNLCMDASDVKKKITEKTVAVIHVHIGGLISKDILSLQKICKERKLHLVEDSAQAHGSSLNGTKAGAFGVASGFSFFSTKVMTTGEGGMVTTSDQSFVEKMKSMREFGKVKTGIYINYHTSIGYNWRMPEISAILGIRQLASLPKFIKRRNEIAKIYDALLAESPDIRIVRPEAGSINNYYKYIVVLPNHDRSLVHKALQEKGIQPSGYVYELPLHKQPVFPFANKLSLPKTEFLCAHHMCLPIFYGMTDAQARYVAKTLTEALTQNKVQVTGKAQSTIPKNPHKTQ